MHPTAAAATKKVDAEKAGYTEAFAIALTLLASHAVLGDIFGQVPRLFVSNFDAERSELWLWDESSGSAYLTHASGREGSHRRDYTTHTDLIGRVSETCEPHYNVALVDYDDGREFSLRTGLTHMCALPLLGSGHIVGVIANYTHGPASEELVQWWELCGQIAASTLHHALANREQQKTISQLSLLFEASKQLNSTLDLAEVLELILKIARTEVKAERGTVYLVDRERKQLWSIIAQGLESREIRLPFGHGVAGRVALTGEVINVADAYTLDYFDRSFDEKFGYTTRSLLCVPIRHPDGYIVGVIQLLNQSVTGEFTVEDEEFLLKLSVHMATALENARHHREAMGKQRTDRELEMAHTIHRGLLPENPQLPGYDMAVHFEPSRELGADYYDVIWLSPTMSLLVIADVHGTGMAAALKVSKLHATMRALTKRVHSLEEIARTLNEVQCNESPEGSSVSIFLAYADSARGGLHCINAGYPEPLIVRSKTGQQELVGERGPAMGMNPALQYERRTVNAEAGDVLVFYSDVAAQEQTIQRIALSVRKNIAASAIDIVGAITAELPSTSDAVLGDDELVIVLKTNPR